MVTTAQSLPTFTVNYRNLRDRRKGFSSKQCLQNEKTFTFLEDAAVHMAQTDLHCLHFNFKDVLGLGHSQSRLSDLFYLDCKIKI